MSTLEDELHRLMGEETARLRAAPDLVDRVVRSTRRRHRTKRIGFTALVAAAAFAAAAVPAYLVLGPDSVAVPEPAVSGPAPASETSRPEATDEAAPEPPAIDDTIPAPSPTRDLGDLGDGKAFKSLRVGYLPKRLQWSHWSLDFGDKYTTSWNYDGDSNGFYCVQIYVHEGQAVQEVDERVQGYRDEGEGAEVAVGDRTGYLVRQGVGEDGGDGTPTLVLSVGEGRRVEVMFSPDYAKDLGGAEAVDRELKKIGENLTAAD
ncbi:hypothetical protein ACFFMN_02480 [Planobispora siamensis]|uniref:Uncharacterized protein n=1 Tax=Planobispora siamensis TaxID=936338 RepID=A0A8J3SES5_9ACTN|nr:hypothetical protein [Planobispora siamensis]GIH93022.1 hypothetical protein Psi01_36520 [Planobispora siamensis]